MSESIKDKMLSFIRKYSYLIIIILLLISIIIILIKPTSKTTKIIKEETKSQNQELINKEEKIKVEIKGMILNPGVYELDNNSRVEDLINLSGGMLENANTNYINLSKKLSDEMIVIVYSNEEIERYKENSKSNYDNITIECICPDAINDSCIEKDNISKPNNIDYETEKDSNKEEIKTDINSKISINEADLNKLMEVSGIGESKAKAIIEYRNNNGRFNSIDDIKNVSGIGNSLFEKIKDYITI